VWVLYIKASRKWNRMSVRSRRNYSRLPNPNPSRRCDAVRRGYLRRKPKSKSERRARKLGNSQGTHGKIDKKKKSRIQPPTKTFLRTKPIRRAKHKESPSKKKEKLSAGGKAQFVNRAPTTNSTPARAWEHLTGREVPRKKRPRKKRGKLHTGPTEFHGKRPAANPTAADQKEGEPLP